MLIPKIFHRVWIGQAPIPQEFEEYWQGWQDNHPDWQFLTWNYPMTMPLSILDRSLLERVYQVFPKSSDLVRYEVLHQFGGVYLDCDFECYKNIEPLIGDALNFAAYQQEGVVNNAIMGAVPGSELFAQILRGAEASFQRHSPDMLHAVGPYYFSEMVMEHPDMTIIDTKYLYPYLWVEEFQGRESYPEAYAVHHWAGTPWK